MIPLELLILDVAGWFRRRGCIRIFDWLADKSAYVLARKLRKLCKEEDRQ